MHFERAAVGFWGEVGTARVLHDFVHFQFVRSGVGFFRQGTGFGMDLLPTRLSTSFSIDYTICPSACRTGVLVRPVQRSEPGGSFAGTIEVGRRTGASSRHCDLEKRRTMSAETFPRSETVPLKLGHSPDSDDAFMFYGLAEHLVDSEGLEFEHILRDIETLNKWATEGRLEFTAISVHAYAYVHDKYAILSHGASMGDGYGPMVVVREPMTPDLLPRVRIAIPGLMTSAFLALSLYLPEKFEYVVMPFNEIMEAVAEGKVEAGLLIHEGQLTHQSLGLYNILDLGKWWKEETGLPLPLGVNAIRKDLPPDVQARASRVLKASIVHGLEHRQKALEHAMQFARDMETETADTFVGMYVNDWTIDMGDAGRRSIQLFLDRAAARGLIPPIGPVEFVE